MKVSLITIVRNGEGYIERTIQSALGQDFENIEYLVIDGASTDGTLAIINRYRDRISRVVSEPDQGISDAWNKGLALATGDVIGFLNAGDEHYPDAVQKAVKVIQAGADMTYGDTELVDDDGRVLRFNRGRFHPWWYSAGFGFYHPSVFARKSLYDTIGGFSLKCRYAMDSDWITRAMMAAAVIEHADSRTRMVDGGVSVANRFLAYGEHLQALASNGAGSGLAFKSMLMTGLRGMARGAIQIVRGRRPG
jgi:glycosyltransferase involved in cell wall biosynthesis